MTTLAPHALPAVMESLVTASTGGATGTEAAIMSLHVTTPRDLKEATRMLQGAGLNRLGTHGSWANQDSDVVLYAAGTAQQWRAAAQRWSRPPRKRLPFVSVERATATIRTAGIETATGFDSPGGQGWTITVHPEALPQPGSMIPAGKNIIEAILSRVLELGGTPSGHGALRTGATLTYLHVQLPNLEAVTELARLDTIRRLEPIAVIGLRAG